MSLYVVDIHGDIEGDYEIIRKYEEPRKGHWIEHVRNGLVRIECSNCSYWFLRSHLVRNSYCPNCGADMRGEQDE